MKKPIEDMLLRVGVLTVSDRVSNGEMEDVGGPAVREALGADWRVVHHAVVPDEVDRIAGTLRRWTDEEALDVIFTTGGTGLGPRDVTPEATQMIVTRMVPGIAEHVRAVSLRETQGAMLSRAVAGIRGETLIVNLPGSPRGALEGVGIIRPVLEHAVSTLRGAHH